MKSPMFSFWVMLGKLRFIRGVCDLPPGSWPNKVSSIKYCHKHRGGLKHRAECTYNRDGWAHWALGDLTKLEPLTMEHLWEVRAAGISVVPGQGWEPSLGIWCPELQKGCDEFGTFHLEGADLGLVGRSLMRVDCSSASEDCCIATGSMCLSCLMVHSLLLFKH